MLNFGHKGRSSLYHAFCRNAQAATIREQRTWLWTLCKGLDGVNIHSSSTVMPDRLALLIENGGPAEDRVRKFLPKDWVLERQP